MVLIQHLYGIRSLRRVAEEVSANIYYRWFLGYAINEPTPHFSTLSYNFRHRFSEKTVDKIFNWILDEIANEGYLNPEAVFIDGTHIKANANKNKKIKEQVPVAAKRYAEELLEEINADREAHGKKPFDDEQKPPKSKNQQKKNNTSKKKLKRRKKEAKMKEVTKSTTDPESGLFVKGDHKRQLEKYPEVKAVVLDAAYKTPHICKKIFDDERIISTAYKRPQTKEGNHPWYTYVYDEHYDCIICPEYKILTYSTTNREGYREYKSDPKVCEHCPTRHLCTASKDFVKTVTKHIWNDYVELAEDFRHTPEYAELYRLRKEKIERVFADAKEKHAMRYTPYRGLTAVRNWVRLKFAAMNLKKFAIRKDYDRKRKATHIQNPCTILNFAYSLFYMLKPEIQFA